MMNAKISDQEYLELQEDYLKAVPEVIAVIENCVLTLERDGFDQDVLRNLKREVHSLKGSSASYDMDLMSTICHKWEDFISDQETETFWNNSENINKVLQFVDLLKSSVRAYTLGNEEMLSNIQNSTNSIQLGDYGAGNNILIVEGSKTVALQLGLFFKDHNMNVSYAKNGYEALGRMLHEKFDYLITSAHVPPLDGMSLIKVIKSIDSNSNGIKTILISSVEKKLLSEESVSDFKVLKDGHMLERFNEIFNPTFTTIKDVKQTPSKAEIKEDLPDKEIANILYVDDDETMTVLVKSVLNKVEGLTPLISNTKEETFSLLNSQIPDLIILDVLMPDISGPEMARLIKRSKRHKDVPIIFLTAYTDKKELDELGALDPAGILKKPIKPKEFFQEIIDIWKKKGNVS